MVRYMKTLMDLTSNGAYDVKNYKTCETLATF